MVTTKIILENYKTPGHPTAFSAPENVANFYGISVGKAKAALEHEDAYVLHREYKRPAVFNPYYVYERRKLIQADLIDIQGIKKNNNGCSFLLLLIDTFSRRIWVYSLKSKSGNEMVQCLTKWLNRLSHQPAVFMTDAGTEFFNQGVKSLLQSRNISHRKAVGTSKACFAERANKSLQILIFKYLRGLETLRYIDALPDLVQTYNSRPHRSLEKMSPNEADLPSNENRVRAIHMKRYSSINGKRKKPIYKKGDIVRIKTDAKAPSSSKRAYAIQYHGEYFLGEDGRDGSGRSIPPFLSPCIS